MIDFDTLKLWHRAVLLTAFNCYIIDYLSLWEVSIPAVNLKKFEEELLTLVLDEESELLSTAGLSMTFSRLGHLHVAVNTRPGGECECSCISVEFMMTVLLPDC